MQDQARKGYRSAMLSAAVLVLAGGLAHADEDAAHDLSIKQQDLGLALTEFSKQSGVEVFFQERDVRGKTSPDIKGSYTTEQAIHLLLDGAGIAYTVNEDGTLLVGGGYASEPREEAATRPRKVAQARPEPPSRKPQRTARQDETATLDVIIVNARRRDESLQDVPIAVSAISGEQAELIGVDATDTLAVTTPTLDFSQQGSFAAIPFLRGVGSATASAGAEQPVAIYVDDVYIASPNANLFALDNIENVQVLKGPQGTLFGRNATGGVIQIKTKQPALEPSGRVSVGYGNYETVQGDFYATGPLSETIAANIALSGSKQSEGYGESVTTGAETQKSKDWNVRAQILINLSEATSVKISGDYSRLESDFGANPSIFPGTIGLGGTEFAGDFNTAGAGSDLTRIEQAGVSLHINHEMSFADLVGISAYRKTDMHAVIDQDASLAPFLTLDLTSPTRTFSQEVRLVSNTAGPLQWVTGLYYFHSNSQYDPGRLTGLIFDPAVADPTYTFEFEDKQKLDSYSGFAEGTYAVFDATNITLGIRYTQDAYEFESTRQVLSAQSLAETPVPGGVFEKEDDFDKLTYRAILDHKFAPGILGYISYSRGFKSGGYNLPEPGTQATQVAIRPEVLDAYEVGLKTTFFDALTFNVAGFFYDYQDLAVSITRTGSLFVVNAAGAEIKGIDADFAFSAGTGFHISGGIGLLDSEYTEFPNGPTYVPNEAPPFGNAVVPADLAGKTTQRAPDLTFSLAPRYSFRAGNGEVTLAASFYHNSGFFSDPENRLEQPSYSLINTSAGYRWDNGMSVRLWARNLTDERYYTFLQAGPLKDSAAYAPPRTYGFTLAKDF
ncbi:TonB-dependent receptor domain-containing protein [Henriciella aquimarina]|uniref:TonB-dependent receptor domain-containing protein n=1 Tax=Henriciella aquimarina TaxID=545261 RepID=UPI000A022203|nr:TonB-dependent receptor [Henriciella aquimarina]